MSNNKSLQKNNRNEDRKEESPPYSRLFVVCSKELRETDLKPVFEEYGDIEDLYMPKNRDNGEYKGVAYIKYQKVSSAAHAIAELHLKTPPNFKKPIKVMIASNMNDKSEPAPEKLKRLFVKIPKDKTEKEIRDCFSEYGTVESVYIQKDKFTQMSKGLAYIQFDSFYEAATALEECDKSYKAVFALPRQDLKRSRESNEPLSANWPSDQSSAWSDRPTAWSDQHNDIQHQRQTSISALMPTTGEKYKAVRVTCTPALFQRYLQRLFNIIPGMINFQYSDDPFTGCCRAFVSYEDERAAAYAVEKLHNYEFPSGEIVTVKPDNPLSKAANDLSTIVSSFKNAVDAGNPDLVQLAEAIAHASSLIKAATTGRVETRSRPEFEQEQYCSVPLPPVQPLTPHLPIAMRCFIICYPLPPPDHILRDIFCRFGNLIDITSFPNKTYAYVIYGSATSAQMAIKTLHGASVTGIRMKVLEATEKSSNSSSLNTDSDGDVNMNMRNDRKRQRLGNRD